MTAYNVLIQGTTAPVRYVASRGYSSEGSSRSCRSGRVGILTGSQYLTTVEMVFASFMAGDRCLPEAKLNEGVDLLDYIKCFGCPG